MNRKIYGFLEEGKKYSITDLFNDVILKEKVMDYFQDSYYKEARFRSYDNIDANFFFYKNGCYSETLDISHNAINDLSGLEILKVVMDCKELIVNLKIAKKKKNKEILNFLYDERINIVYV